MTPSFFDLGIGDSVLDRWDVFGLRTKDSRGRRHVEPVGLLGLAIIRSRVGHRVKRNFNLLNILIGHPRNVLHRWPEVVDHVVVIDNICDVLRLPDDLHVLLRGLDIRRVAGLTPMRITDKSVSSRSNAIIRVGPRRYRLTRRDVCFRRKRRPANLFITFPPGDPSGRPLIAGNPAPSGPTNICPSAIMVGCPGKTLV